MAGSWIVVGLILQAGSKFQRFFDTKKTLKNTIMKKLLILFAAILFGITATFAQGVWTLRVDWSEDDCTNCSNGYYEVLYSIYDNFNDVPVYTNETVTGISLTAGYEDIPVPLVEDNCELESETYRPNYEIRATVYKYCYYSLVPELICLGANEIDDKTCYNFYNGIVTINVVITSVD